MTAASLPAGEPTERRKFQLTDLSGNSNKWYMIETWPLSDGTLLFRATYGRVGATPQTDDKITSRAWIERKIREKLTKGYHEVALHRPTIVAAAPVAACNIDPAVKQVVDWIYAEARENIAAYLAVGLDALSAEQIERGRVLLGLAQRQYATWQHDHSQVNAAMLAGTVQQFYNAVPTRLPHRIEADTVVQQFCADFDQQENRLNQLEAAVATQVIEQRSPQVSPYDALGAELHLLPQNAPRFGEIADYIERTQTHGFRARVRNIFSVYIEQERRAFEQNRCGTQHMALLFHGTVGQNVRHILRSGLICPRTPSHGRMFGHGIYFANQSSKSINYCATRTRRVPHFLLLADVALGNTYVAPDAMSDLRAAPRGYDSVHGKAGFTGAWGGKLNYDEFIVYAAAQQSIRYLVTLDR